MKIINAKGAIVLVIIICIAIYTARKIPFVRNSILGLNDQENNPNQKINQSQNQLIYKPINFKPGLSKDGKFIAGALILIYLNSIRD